MLHSEMMSMNYLGQPGTQLPTGQSPQMFLQPITLQRPPASYKVGPVPQHMPTHNQHTLLPPVSLSTLLKNNLLIYSLIYIE